jgi:hypothetical protein
VAGTTTVIYFLEGVLFELLIFADNFYVTVYIFLVDHGYVHFEKIATC